MTNTASVTARMETILGEAAPSTETKETIVRDIAALLPAEKAELLKIQAEGKKALATLKKVLDDLDGGFFRFAAAALKRDSALSALADKNAAIHRRAESGLSSQDLGDLEEELMFNDAANHMQDILWTDKMKTLRRNLESVVEAFEEFADGKNSEVAGSIRSIDDKMKFAQSLLKDK